MITRRSLSMRLRALAVALAAASAHAEQEVALEYRAPEACPDRAHFAAQMADRGGRLHGTKSTERVAELAVAIEGSSTSGFAGTLLVTAPDSSSTSREIQDPDCAKVVTGLAVVGAIALFGTEDGELPAPALEDQTRSTRPTTTPRARPVEAPSPPEQEIRETTLRGSSFGQPDSVEVSAGTLRFERARRITLSGGIDYGLVKELPMPRFDLRTSLGEFIVTPSGGTRLVGPLLQVRWSLYGPGNRTEGGRESRALGFGAGVAVCSAFTYDDRGLASDQAQQACVSRIFRR